MAQNKRVLTPETERVLGMLIRDLDFKSEQMRSARELLKGNLVKAIEDGELSVAKAAILTGTDRRTITLWLAIHNGAKKSEETPK